MMLMCLTSNQDTGDCWADVWSSSACPAKAKRLVRTLDPTQAKPHAALLLLLLLSSYGGWAAMANEMYVWQRMVQLLSVPVPWARQASTGR